MTEGQSLYVIADPIGRMKVGVSKDLRRRIRDCERDVRRPLDLRRAVPFVGGDPEDVERYAHWLLREHHDEREWFNIDEATALGALLAAGIAVTKGLRAPRPGFGGRGRRHLWTERLNVTLPTGAKAQIEAALQNGEDSLDLAREAISAELERRGFPRLPDPKADKTLRPPKLPPT